MFTEQAKQNKVKILHSECLLKNMFESICYISLLPNLEDLQDRQQDFFCLF